MIADEVVDRAMQMGFYGFRTHWTVPRTQEPQFVELLNEAKDALERSMDAIMICWFMVSYRNKLMHHA